MNQYHNISDTLRHWCDESGIVSRKQIADVADCSVQSVGRWISGEAEPALDHCRRLSSTRSRLPAALGQAIAAWMLRDTGREPCPIDKPTRDELDANKNGQVDPNDLTRFSVGAIQHGAKAAAKLATGETSDEVLADLLEAHRHFGMAIAAHHYMVGQKRVRIAQ